MITQSHNTARFSQTVSVALLVAMATLGPHPLNAQNRAEGNAETPASYVVKSGDTLYRIALNHGTTVAALQRLNGIQGTTISVGQTLRLRADAAPPENPLFIEAFEDEADEPAEREADAAARETAAPVTPPLPRANIAHDDSVDRPVEVVIDPIAASNAFDVYPAQRGDTFEQIAERLGFAVGVIRALNPDINPPLTGGTEVRRPIQPSALLYSVKDGDTIEALSQTFGASAQVIMAANNLESATLRIGQRLRIPVVEVGQNVSDSQAIGQADGASGGLATGSAGGGAAQNRAEEPDAIGVPVSGTAKVYPTQFEGRIMAIGRAYEGRRFTVSHATLKLGTVVLLTNEATGRKTFAEVTDRPPVGATYLLDVSRAVADVLGLADTGTTITVQVAG